MKLLQYIRKAFNWLTRPERFSLINGTCFGEEDLTDEDIHEIMNLIHKGNPQI